MTKSSPSSSIALPAMTAAAATIMTAISISLMMRTRRALSLISANAPALAEHRKNGRMKRPPASGINSPADKAPAASAR